jgi:hypothetical protein
MPQTSTNQSQHETRPKNATAHPGAPQLAGKRKRRTKAQIEADNKAAAEAKAAEEAKKLAGMKKIANLEMKINEEDSNDVTPKPKATSRPLRRTSSHMFIPLYKEGGPDFSEPLTEQTAPTDNEDNEYQQPTERETTDIEIEESAQPKKKQKKVKGQVREAIKAAGNEVVVRGEGITKAKNPVDSDNACGNREANHGTNSHATGLVLPFLICPYLPCSHLTNQPFSISRSIAIPTLKGE